MKKITLVVLLITITFSLLSLVSCEWVGAVFDSMVRTDGSIELDDELVYKLTNYLNNYYAYPDIIGRNFGEKIKLCQSEYNPINVKFGDECYYAVAYYASTHGQEDKYCCSDKYTWVGFDKAESVKEIIDGKSVVAAFQINKSESAKNIKNGTSDIRIEHFKLFRPEFRNGTMVEPLIKFDKTLVYLTKINDGVVYFSSDEPAHDAFKMDCVELNGSVYIKNYHAKKTDSEENKELYLSLVYGDLYDDLMEILYDQYEEQDGSETEIYGLFKLEDIGKLILTQ
jgi:hypothetical protein